MPFTPQGIFTFLHTNQADTPNVSAATLKTQWDTQANELKTTLNNLIIALEKTTATSGAEQIGSLAITDLTGTTIHAQLVSLRDQLKSVVDGFSGADFINATAIVGLTGGTVQSLLESLNTLKATLDSPTFTGTVVLPSTTSIGTVTNTEIGYLDNVTSPIQTQLDAKASNAFSTLAVSGQTSIVADSSADTLTVVGTGVVVVTTDALTDTITIGVSGVGTGTVTNVSSANADISVVDPTTSPVLTLNSGTGANQIAKRDGLGNFNATTVTTNADLTGEVTSVGNAATVTNAAVIAKLLTGYVSGAGTLADTDSILQAIQKLNGNETAHEALSSSETVKAHVELATAAETTTGTDDTRAVHPAGLKVELDKKANLNGAAFTGTNSHARNLVGQPQIKDYSEALTTDAAVTTTKTLDISTGNIFDLTLTGNVTLTITNPAPTGQACSMTLLVRQGATARVITYPASVAWSGGTIPDITAINKTTLITLITVDGGTRWYGSSVNNYTT